MDRDQDDNDDKNQIKKITDHVIIKMKIERSAKCASSGMPAKIREK